MKEPDGAEQTIRVLVVDDEKNIRLTLAEALAVLDVEVDTAADGSEGIEKAEGADYRIVLLDLRMPGLDGMEVLRFLRAHRPHAGIIVITAHGTIESAVEAMKLGAIDFLSKPFSPETVRAAVRTALARDSMARGGGDEYEVWLDVGRRAIRRGEISLAESTINRAIQMNPDGPQGHNLRGVVCEVLGRLFEAQQAYRKALELDSGYAPARANLRESVDAPHRESFYLSEAKRERIVSRRRGGSSA